MRFTVLLLVTALAGLARSVSSQSRPVGMAIEESPVGSTAGYDSVKSIAFSADSQHVAFLVVKDDKQFVLRDGMASGPFDWVIPASLTLSPDTARVACVIQEGN